MCVFNEEELLTFSGIKQLLYLISGIFLCHGITCFGYRFSLFFDAPLIKKTDKSVSGSIDICHTKREDKAVRHST
jgi:hypothetical protein